MPYISDAGSYLIQTVLGFFIYLVLLRFWMQWVRADFSNPIGQFIISLSNPIIVPLRKILPRLGSIDTATLLLAFALIALKLLLLFSLAGVAGHWAGILLFSVGELIRCSINIFFAAILIQVIASWVAPYSYHPILSIARSIGEPLLAPARRLIPAIGGLDLSPIIVIIFLQLSLRLIVAPLQHLT